MDSTEKHSAELDFHYMIKEVKIFIEKSENSFLDGDEKEHLQSELKKINHRLFDLQMERFSKYINERGKIENLPREEEMLQWEMTELTMRINKLVNSE
jgi:hypothetical protein